MIVKYTDAGRSESGLHERLDCSVRAVAIAFGLSYAQAHTRLKSFGRRDRCRLYKSPRAFCEHLGLIMRPDLSCRTVATALRDMTAGRFIVRVSGHVFAVVDGVIYDMIIDAPKSNSRVKMVYQVPI